jgi:hypothetical protein
LPTTRRSTARSSNAPSLRAASWWPARTSGAGHLASRPPPPSRDTAWWFLQNSINLGLRTIICPAIAAGVGDELDITPAHVTNVTSGGVFPIVPLPAARQAIIEAGGLIAYTRSRLLAERAR